MKQEMQEKNICLFALKRSNSKENWPKSVRQLIFKLRRRVETVFSQLSGQLNAERVLAKSFQGLCTRLVNKVLAYNLCIALNSIFGETCEPWKNQKIDILKIVFFSYRKGMNVMSVSSGRIKSGRLQAKLRTKRRIFNIFLFLIIPKICLGEIFLEVHKVLSPSLRTIHALHRSVSPLPFCSNTDFFFFCCTWKVHTFFIWQVRGD